MGNYTAGMVGEEASEHVRRLREFVAESPEHYFGIGTCKIIGSHDRNYSVRDNLLYMIDRITEAALAQNTQGEGEPVAMVRVTHGGFGMELSTHVAYALPEGSHKLYARPVHAERARVPADMVLVPCEPTREMLCAWRNAEGSDAYYNTGEGIGYCYKAMIAAAPSQPKDAGEVTIDDVCAAMDRIPLSERKPAAPLATTQPEDAAPSQRAEVKP